MPPPSGRSSRRSSSHSRTNSMSSVGRRNSNFGGPRLGMTSAAPQDDLTHSAQNHDTSTQSITRLTTHRSETHLPRLGALQRTLSTTTIIQPSSPADGDHRRMELNDASATKAGSTAATEDEGWESNTDEDSAVNAQAQTPAQPPTPPPTHRRRRPSAASTNGKLTRNKSSNSIHRRQSDFSSAVREVENAQLEKVERKGMFRVHSSQSDIHRPSPKVEQFIVPPVRTPPEASSSLDQPSLPEPSPKLSRAPSGISLSRRSSSIPPLTPAETPLPPASQSSKPSSAEPSPKSTRRPSNASNHLHTIAQDSSPSSIHPPPTEETADQPTRDPSKSAARHHSSISTEPNAYPFPSTSRLSSSAIPSHFPPSSPPSRNLDPILSPPPTRGAVLRQTPSSSSLRSGRSTHTNHTNTTQTTNRPSHLPFLPKRLATLSGAPPGRTAPPQLSSDSARGEASTMSSGWPVSSSPVHSLLSVQGERDRSGEGSARHSPVSSLAALGRGSLGSARERTTSMASLRSTASDRLGDETNSTSAFGGEHAQQHGQRRRMISSSASSRSLNLKEGFRRSIIGGIVEAVGSSLGFDESSESAAARHPLRSATDHLATSSSHTPSSSSALNRHETLPSDPPSHHTDIHSPRSQATHLTSHFRPALPQSQRSRQIPSLHPSPFLKEHLSVLKDMPEGRNSLIAMSVRRCAVSREV